MNIIVTGGATQQTVKLYMANDKIKELQAELEDINAMLELWHKADMRAIEMWRKEHPDKQLTMPYHDYLVAWLLGKIEELHEHNNSLLIRCLELEEKLTRS